MISAFAASPSPAHPVQAAQGFAIFTHHLRLPLAGGSGVGYLLVTFQKGPV